MGQQASRLDRKLKNSQQQCALESHELCFFGWHVLKPRLTRQSHGVVLQLRGDGPEALTWRRPDAAARGLGHTAEDNLHRTDLNVQKRANHIAEWVPHAAENEALCAPPSGRQPYHKAINAAVGELGIDRTEADPTLKMVSITQPISR
jgi:hypothetical protein